METFKKLGGRLKTGGAGKKSKSKTVVSNAQSSAHEIEAQRQALADAETQTRLAERRQVEAEVRAEELYREIRRRDAELAQQRREEEQRQAAAAEAERRVQQQRQEQEQAARQAGEQKRINEERERLQAARHADKGRVRELREYIREKHRLDVEIWQQGNLQYTDREAIIAMGERSDKLMEWICLTVEHWEERHFKRGQVSNTHQSEWQLAQTIKKQMAEVKRNNKSWSEKPRWEYAKGDRALRRHASEALPRSPGELGSTISMAMRNP